jgi:hypothetical protein
VTFARRFAALASEAAVSKPFAGFVFFLVAAHHWDTAWVGAVEEVVCVALTVPRRERIRTMALRLTSVCEHF